MFDKSDFYSKLAEALEFGNDEIVDGKLVQELDSVNIMGLVSLVDEEYEITLFPSDISSCKTLKDVVCLIDQKSKE